MVELIFHVGMGKTGTTSLQAALSENSETVLRDAGLCYLGMWMGMVDPAFEGYGGFQKFLRQTPERQQQSAARLVAHVQERAAREGFTRFLVSNEEYLEWGRALSPFFSALAEQIPLRVLIYARPAGSWLPSACAQWGAYHKTNMGPVAPVQDVARRLVQQYDHILSWHETLGERIHVRLFDRKTDLFADFSTQIGADLPPASRNLQARPAPADLLLRTAFNSHFKAPMLPNAYNQQVLPLLTNGLPRNLSDKFAHLYAYDTLADVITGHEPVWQEIRTRFGIDLATEPVSAPPPYEPAELIDALLGNLLDLTTRQAADLRELSGRLATLETVHKGVPETISALEQRLRQQEQRLGQLEQEQAQVRRDLAGHTARVSVQRHRQLDTNLALIAGHTVPGAVDAAPIGTQAGTQTGTLSRLAAERDAAQARLAEQKQAAEAQKARSRAELAQMQGRMTQMQGSTSWKLTQPLRSLSRLLRRLGRS